ncbi:hypothetical protein BB561_006825, partial [Smittium simulii]
MARDKNKYTEKSKTTNSATSQRAAELLGFQNQGINAFKANAALAFSQFGNLNLNSNSDTVPGIPLEDKNYSKTNISNNFDNIASNPQNKNKIFNELTSNPFTQQSGIDDQLANLFKRMGKKDIITRIKTLQGILKYTNSILESYMDDSVKVTQVISALILGWPTIFKAQVFDLDRKIRMLSINILANFLKITKKKSTACLSQLMGPWICTFFDSSSDIKNLSIAVFEENFNKNKAQKSRVLEFCYKSILEYLIENLTFLHEAKTKYKDFTDEEQKIQFHFMAAGSFRAIEYMLSDDHLNITPDVHTQYIHLLGNKDLWKKFLNSDNNSLLVTKSAYSCFSLWMKKQQSYDFGVINSFEIIQLIIETALKAKPDPVLNVSVWDSIVLATKNYPDIWSMKNKKGKTTLYDNLIYYLECGNLNYSPEYCYNSVFVLLNLFPSSFLLEDKRASQIISSLWLGSPREIKSLIALTTDNPNLKHNYNSNAKENKFAQNFKINESSKNMEMFLNFISESSFYTWKLEINSLSNPIDISSSISAEIFDNIGISALQIFKICIEMISNTDTNKLNIAKSVIKNLIINSSISSSFKDPKASEHLLQIVLESLSEAIDTSSANE